MQKHSSPEFSSWRTWWLVLVLTAGTIGAAAQAPANPRFDRIVASAENGDAASQVELGILYFNGTANSPGPDYAEALKWFHRAADQGNAKAQDRIGLMYYSGKGVPQDYAEAAHWYQLAAQGGNFHARLQLSDMYQRGLGVPRDFSESKKWATLAKTDHPNNQSGYTRAWFPVAILAVLAFPFGLIALQRNVLAGRRRLIVAALVHVAGIALLLNTLATYGFGIVFPHCSHSFLATDCTQISDSHTRMVVNAIGDWAVVNLIFRFMAGVGFVLDALVVWYFVYLWRLIFRRPRVEVPRAVPSSNV
jgi:Sel1 repeat